MLHVTEIEDDSLISWVMIMNIYKTEEANLDFQGLLLSMVSAK